MSIYHKSYQEKGKKKNTRTRWIGGDREIIGARWSDKKKKIIQQRTNSGKKKNKNSNQ